MRVSICLAIREARWKPDFVFSSRPTSNETSRPLYSRESETLSAKDVFHCRGTRMSVDNRYRSILLTTQVNLLAPKTELSKLRTKRERTDFARVSRSYIKFDHFTRNRPNIPAFVPTVTGRGDTKREISLFPCRPCLFTTRCDFRSDPRALLN